jgi:hypothetical protein
MDSAKQDIAKLLYTGTAWIRVYIRKPFHVTRLGEEMARTQISDGTTMDDTEGNSAGEETARTTKLEALLRPGQNYITQLT